jgi:hypothetical protein
VNGTILHTPNADGSYLGPNVVTNRTLGNDVLAQMGTTTTLSGFTPAASGGTNSFTVKNYLQLAIGETITLVNGGTPFIGTIQTISSTSLPATVTVTVVQQGSVTPLPAGCLVIPGGGATRKRGLILKLNSADYTPLLTGLDPGTISWIPYDITVANDAQSIAWLVQAIKLRAETPGSTATTLQVARSTGTGVFSNAGYLNTTALSLAASAYEVSMFNAALAVGTVNSGDKLQINWTALGTGMVGPTVIVELRET